MKKLLLISLIGICASAQAHEVWVNAPAKLASSDTLRADLAYSHDFPHAEKIADDRLHIFAPLQLTSPDGKHSNMKQQGENYQYTGGKLKKGSYIISATYKPTFWSKDAAGKRRRFVRHQPPDRPNLGNRTIGQSEHRAAGQPVPGTNPIRRQTAGRRDGNRHRRYRCGKRPGGHARPPRAAGLFRQNRQTG